MRVCTKTTFKDLKEKKLRKPGEEFDCTEERYEEIKKYVEPVQEEPKKAEKAKKTSK